jgi:hypothetical protein
VSARRLAGTAVRFLIHINSPGHRGATLQLS